MRGFALNEQPGTYPGPINIFSASFPTTVISLTMSNPHTSSDGLLTKVSDYVKANLGSRANLQNNSLSAKTSMAFAPVVIIKKFNASGKRGG